MKPQSLFVCSVIIAMALAGLIWLNAGPAAQAEPPARQTLVEQPSRAVINAPTAATLGVYAPTGMIPGGQVFTVAVRLSGLEGRLAAFQFDLDYDPALIAYMGETHGDLLSATGRTVVCPPVAQPSAGRVRLACASTGDAPGPGSDGMLSVLTFRVTGAGYSPLTLANVQLINDASPPGLLAATPQNSGVLVGVQAAVALSAAQTQSAPPGAMATYVFTLTNYGGYTDTFGLQLSGHTWPVTLSTTSVGPVTPGGSAPFSLSVGVPASAADGQQETVIITATAGLDSNVTAQTRATTIARISERKIYLPVILKNHSAGQQSRRPGNGYALWLSGSLLPALLYLAADRQRRRIWQRFPRHLVNLMLRASASLREGRFLRHLVNLIVILSLLLGTIPLTPASAAPLNTQYPIPNTHHAPRPTSTVCFWADVDCDHDIDGNDLSLMAEHWNCASGQACYDALFDRDGDGDIDALDLAHLGNQYDVTPPQLSITSPAHGAVVGGASVQVSGIVSDAHPIAWVVVNGVTATIPNAQYPLPIVAVFTATIPVAAGNQNINAIAADELGATSSAAIVIGVDGEGPFIAINAPRTRQSVYTLQPTLAVSYTDFYTGVNTASLDAVLARHGGGTTGVTWDWVGATGARGHPSALLVEDSSYTLTVTLQDVLGNPAQAIATFYVPSDVGSITPPEIPDKAGWVSGVVYDSTTCEGGQEQPIRCQGIPGARVTLERVDTTALQLARQARAAQLAQAEQSGLGLPKQPAVTTITIPLSGTVVSGPDGFFAFPVAQTARYRLRVEKPGYTYGQREDGIVLEHSTPVNEIYLTPLDPAVTVCDSTITRTVVHTSADGQMVVMIPPGAIAPGDVVTITATEFDQVEFLPSGGLPEGTWETYAFNLGGDSDYTFLQPITVSIRNSKGFEPGSEIPLGYWNQQLMQWEHEGVAVVDPTGEWVVMQMLHFSNHDPNYPITQATANPKLDPQSQRDKQCADKDTSGSAIIVRSGVLRQDVELPAVETLLGPFAPSLMYDSGRANPSELIEFDLGMARVPGLQLLNYVQVELYIAGFKTANFTFAINEWSADGEIGRFRYLWDGRDAQGNRLPPGVYRYAAHVRIPYRAQYFASLNNRFGAPPDYTRPVNRWTNAAISQWLYGSITLNSAPDNPFGMGWTLRGLQRLYEDEAGHILIDSGCCLDEYYFPGKDLLEGGTISPTSQLLWQETSRQGDKGTRGQGDKGTSDTRYATRNTQYPISNPRSRPPGLASLLPARLRRPLTTDVGGVIITNTTWTLAGSPYVLTSDTIVTRGITLTIEPGVIVKGNSNVELKVLGNLVAIGTPTQPITFTSATNSGPNQWSGLVFDGALAAGDLRHVLVRYGGDVNSLGGSTAGANLYLRNGADVRIESSQVRDGSAYYDSDAYFGLYASNGRVVVSDTLFVNNGHSSGTNDYALYSTGGSAITVTNSVFQSNAGWAVYVEADDVQQVQNCAFAGNGYNRILVGGGTFVDGASLVPQTGLQAYQFWSDMTIAAGRTLTVAPGVMTMWQADVELKVLGNLVAIGTPTQPITFTSATNSGPNQWSGLVFDGALAAGDLRHVLVRYGGDVNSLGGSTAGANLYLRNGADVRIESSQVRDGSAYYDSDAYFGLYVSNGRVVVSDTLFVNNGHSSGTNDYALYTTGGSAITVTNSTFQSNAGWAVRVEADDVQQVQNCTFAGNGYNRVRVGGGTFADGASLVPQTGLQAYQFENDMTVAAGRTLTVAPDVMTMWQDNVELKVLGNLVAIGTPPQPITFTSATNSGPNQWSGLVFDGGVGDLRHVLVRYSGDVNSLGGSTAGANLYLRNGADVRIESSQVRDGSAYYDSDAYFGLYGLNSRVVVSDTLFVNNGHGSGTNDYALYATGSSVITVTDNIFQRNAGYPLRIPARDVSQLKRNIFIANGYNRARLYGDYALAVNTELAPQTGLAGYEFEGNLTIPAGITLTVEPGVWLFWASGKGLTVHGSLAAMGERTQPITFTSSTNTGPGQWAGILFGDGIGRLDHATVRYAVNGLRVQNGDVTLRYSSVVNNSQNGIHLTGGNTRFFAVGSSISGNGPRPSYYGLRNDTGRVVDARYNWWGHLSGPYHPTANPTGQGNQVSNNVLFDPWLEAPSQNLGIIKRTATDQTTLIYSTATHSYIRLYPDGSEVHFNPDGTHAYTLDPAGNKTAYVYEYVGQVANLSHIHITPAGESTPRWTWTFSYQPSAIIRQQDTFAIRHSPFAIRITDPAGRVTTLEMDRHGNLTRVAFPDDSDQVFAYNADHLMTHKQDGLGNINTYVYDAHGRISRLELAPRPVYDPASGALTMQQEVHTYTPSDVAYQLVNDLAPGDPLSPTAPLVKSDQLVERVEFEPGGYQGYSNEWGSLTQVTDALSNTTRYERDEQDRITRTLLPSGNCLEFTYDENGNRLSEARMGAAQCALPPEQRDPAQVRTWRYTYEPRFGQLRSTTDPLGNTTTRVYDYEAGSGQAGRLVEIRYPPVLDENGQTITPTVRYTYNAWGQLETITDQAGVVTRYIYTQGSPDEAFGQPGALFAAGVVPVPGLLTRVVEDEGGIAQATVWRDFDAAGNPLTILGAACCGGGRATRYAYDAWNRVISETNALGIVTRYVYDAVGRLTSQVEDYTADGTTGRNVTTEYTYDAAGNLLTVRTEADGLVN